MDRGGSLTPDPCLISFASSKETGNARSPSSGRGGTSALNWSSSTPKSSIAAARTYAFSRKCITINVVVVVAKAEIISYWSRTGRGGRRASRQLGTTDEAALLVFVCFVYFVCFVDRI